MRASRHQPEPGLMSAPTAGLAKARCVAHTRLGNGRLIEHACGRLIKRCGRADRRRINGQPE
eukprot:13526763-Alexandrium_andersonii.AAC.1